MSPVERTAAWVLNNGQYEDEEEEGQSKDDAKHVEKVLNSIKKKMPANKHCKRF